jgi:protein involved in polysaccharide export with SLBB domain
MVDKSASRSKHKVRTKDSRSSGRESLADPFVIAQGAGIMAKDGAIAVGAGCRRMILGIGLVLATVGSSLLGQTLFAQTQQVPVTSSELARQNMSHVAASVGQIVAVLHRDPGLMVELKKWIAKDATDHGQLISDADLADEAILERLETDMSFRSVATLLLQKYGYLQPNVNPDSAAGREQQLLIQERVRFLAQQGGGTAYTAPGQSPQQTGSCDPVGGNCSPSISPSPSQPSQQPGIQTPTEMPGLQAPHTPQGSPYLPPQQTPPNNNVTDLMRTSGQDTFGMDQMQGNNALGGISALPGDESGQFNSSQQRSGETSIQPVSTGPSGNHFEDASLSSEFGGDQSNKNLYAANLPNGGAYGASPFASGSFDANSGMPLNEATGNKSPAVENSLRLRESNGANARLVRRPNPYNYIPSLYDMYLQATPHPASLDRFGMQVFQNGTRDLQSIPMDLPVGPDYVLGSGDAIAVDLWGGVSRRFYEVVDREGRISLPEIGPVLVAGKSLADVQQSVQRTLRTQFRDVSADVSLARLRTIRVYVVGDVVKPGAYDIGSLSTPLNALFSAGGPTPRGSLRIVKHLRGNQLVQDVDVYDLLLHGVKGDIQRLENGDTVMVPPLGPEVTIEGMVRRPAIYEQKDEKSLADALALSGGLLPGATFRHIEVQRLVAHQKQTMLSLDIPATDSVDEATRQLESFQIQDGDKIRIFPIAPYAQDAVYLEGHVIRPGKYSFRDGMRVTDLISSYKDLLPEPASSYGEIIRLSAPDFRPTVESFDLAKVLADPSKAPVLQPLDTVQIFGRYDFENPPVVSVLGDVRVPGTYKTSGDIHLSDAIHLAGGLTQDAQTTDAQVFRYMPDSTLKILNVKLDGALQGSPSDNIVLTPRDRVLVHRNAAATDPATVNVKGEVARPGRYPLTANMRISDLIHAAGGLKQSADTNVADLTHFVWQDDKQVSGQQEQIVLADVLTGSSEKDGVLNNGDVLSIRQVPGWDDLGASITIRGEVAHPGSYGIRPGEKLSSVLLRAGGFGPRAYPYGALLMRSEVQKLEQRSYGELIQRVREQQATLKLTATSATDPDQRLSAESAFVQWQTTVDNLVNSPPTGRVTIQISADIGSWENTPRDVTLRPGDILMIPKRPSFVLVQGQVYGPTAVAYRPGKNGKWYLMQAGGTTNMANKKAIFVVRADGTVVGNNSGSWFTGDALSVALQPGDMVVAPEKALGGPPIWKTLFQNAQVLSSIATSAILAAHY